VTEISGATDGPAVVILADDLIWLSRLDAQVQAVGARPVRASTLERFEAALADADVAIIDLTARRYDGLTAIGRAAAAGCRVLAIGQHDDHLLRRRALEAGADRVFAYRKLFEDGPATLRRWLDRAAAVR
jgi:DNA-binding NarL/FixJ family response regulator